MVYFSKCYIKLSICKVGDCGLHTYQTVTVLMRATTIEFTSISPILYIHCYRVLFLVFQLILLSLLLISSLKDNQQINASYKIHIQKST
jgi:hypothetical protein